jgi:NRPS condensation-like uncharacterized protein
MGCIARVRRREEDFPIPAKLHRAISNPCGRAAKQHTILSERVLGMTVNTRYKAEIWDVMQLFFSKFNDHQIHCVIRLDTRIDKSRLKRAVDLLCDAFPLLKCRLTVEQGIPCWEDAGLNSDSMVFLKTAKDPDAELGRLICSRNSERIGPQLTVFIVRSQNADTLCVIINHMLCDAAGFKEILYLLCSIYSRLKSDPDFRPPAENAPRGTQQILNELDWKQRIKILFQPYRLSRHDDSIVFELEGDESSPFLVTHTIPASRFLAAKTFAKQYGATVNDVMLAAYLRALQQYIPGKTTAIQCILDLRKYLPCPHSKRLCNLTSTLVCDIGPDVGATFGDTLSKVKSAMDAEKQQVRCLHLILLLETVFRILPYSLLKKVVWKAYRNPPLAMSNIGILDHRRLVFDQVPAKGAFMSGSIKYKPYFQLALSTFRNELTLSVAFHGTQADQTKIEQFLEAVDRELPVNPGQ